MAKSIAILTCNTDPIGSGSNSSADKSECKRRLEDITGHGITVYVVDVKEAEETDSGWWAAFDADVSRMFDDDDDGRMTFDRLSIGNVRVARPERQKWVISATQSLPDKVYSLVQPIPKLKIFFVDKEKLREVVTTTKKTCATRDTALLNSKIHTAFQIGGPHDRQFIAFSGDEVTRCKEGDDALPWIFLLCFAPRSCVVDPSQNMLPSRFMRPDETWAPGST